MSSDLSVADRSMMVNRDLSGARYGRTRRSARRFGKPDSSRVNPLNAPKAVPLQRVSRQVAQCDVSTASSNVRFQGNPEDICSQ
jgi:hypothetical protein